MAELPALPSGFEIDGDIPAQAVSSPNLPALPSGYVLEGEEPQEPPAKASIRKAKESDKKKEALRKQLTGTDVNMFPGGFSDILRQNLQNVAGAPRIPQPTAIAASEQRAKDLAQAYQLYSGEELAPATVGYMNEAPYLADREPAKPESQLKTLARKGLRYGGATAGGVTAGLASIPTTGGLASIPAASAGAMLGYGMGRGVEELLMGQEPQTAYTDRPMAQALTSWGVLPEVKTPGQRAYKGGTLGQGLKEMVLNVPDSTARLVEGALGMPYALGKASVTPGGGEQTAKDMYHMFAAPLGLMGSDAAKDAWVLDPAGSTLAASMVYKGATGLRNRALSEQQLNSYIDRKYPHAVGMSSAKIASDPAIKSHLKDAQGAVKTIVALKDEGKINVGEFGAEEARLPRNRMEFAQAIQQAKENVFNLYNGMKEKAGEKGATIGLDSLVTELDSMSNNSALKDFRPNVVQKIQELSARLKERGAYTVEEANNAIKIANQAYENYLKNPSVETGEMAVVDAFVANHLRKAMDLAIESEAGPGWQAYRNKYKQLRSIEKEVTKGALSEAKKSPIGLLDFSDMFSAGEAISGIISMNPAQFAKGGAMFMLKRIYKNLKDPHTSVTKIFEKTDKHYKRSPGMMSTEPWIGTVDKPTPLDTSFNPEVVGPKGPSTGFETIKESRPLGLEEGGIPPEKPVAPPERIFAPGEKAGIVSPPDTTPQASVGFDIQFAREQMTKMGLSPEEINTAIDAMKKGGVAAGLAILAPFLSEDDREKVFGTGAMLGMVGGFHSSAKNAIKSLPGESIKAQSIPNALRKMGVTEAEIKDLGLVEQIKQWGNDTKVPKAELENFINKRGFKIGNEVLGEPKLDLVWIDEKGKELSHADAMNRASKNLPVKIKGGSYWADDMETFNRAIELDSPDQVKFKEYKAIPGDGDPGTYREGFVTAELPKQPIDKNVIAQEMFGQDYKSLGQAAKNIVDGEHKNQVEYGRFSRKQWKEISRKQWKDPHSAYSDIDNPVGRYRYDIQTQPDGRRVMRVHEFQAGYNKGESAVPESLRERTYDLLVKKVLVDAQKQGLDGVSWSTGDQQVDLYSNALRNVANEARWNPETQELQLFKDGRRVAKDQIPNKVPENKLEDYIGKAAARRLVESEERGGKSVFKTKDEAWDALNSLDKTWDYTVMQNPDFETFSVYKSDGDIPVKFNSDFKVTRDLSIDKQWPSKLYGDFEKVGTQKDGKWITSKDADHVIVNSAGEPLYEIWDDNGTFRVNKFYESYTDRDVYITESLGDAKGWVEDRLPDVASRGGSFNTKARIPSLFEKYGKGKVEVLGGDALSTTERAELNRLQDALSLSRKEIDRLDDLKAKAAGESTPQQPIFWLDKGKPQSSYPIYAHPATVAVGGALASYLLDDEQREKMLGTGAMLGMVGGFKAKGFDKGVKFSDLTDKQQRFWFSDQNSKLISGLPEVGEKTLRNMLDHPLLYENYPGIGSVPVRENAKIKNPSVTGWGIEFPKGYKGDVKSVLLHESQHLIQDIEDFSKGGSSENIPQYVLNMVKNDEAKIKEHIRELNKQKRDTSIITNFMQRSKIASQIVKLKEELDMIKNDPRNYVYRHLLGEEEARRVSRQSMMRDQTVSKNPYTASDIPDIYNLIRKNSNSYVK